MFGLTLGTLQYSLFPALALLVMCMPLAGERVPRSVLMFALGGVLASATVAFLWRPTGSWAVAAAVLQNDEYEVETFKLRERVNYFLRHQGATRAVRYHREISSAKQATEFLRRSPDQMALVWGNRGWVNVSLPENRPLDIGSTKLGAHYELLRQVKLVTSVPGVGLSVTPRNETAQFIAGILRAVTEVAQNGAALKEQPTSETILRDSGNLFAPWSGSAHRALPWWLLGNRLLLGMLESGAYQRAELKCAREAYQRALSFVKPKDAVSADMFAASMNNLGVLTLVESVLEGSTSPVKDARPLFREALAVRSSPNVFGLEVRAVEVAIANLSHFKKILHKSHHSKKS
ncbi:MAG: hypothetical protein K1X79_13030 [Oligoflexia bacterium]|nr:hypothetical protein [Oligoflexia bacterium]